MDPEWRLEGELYPNGQSDARDAAEAHHEKGWAVARIGEGVVEAADLAVRTQAKETLEQMAQIGREACRERGGEYVGISVVRVSIKKKNKNKDKNQQINQKI